MRFFYIILLPSFLPSFLPSLFFSLFHSLKPFLLFFILFLLHPSSHSPFLLCFQLSFLFYSSPFLYLNDSLPHFFAFHFSSVDFFSIFFPLFQNWFPLSPPDIHSLTDPSIYLFIHSFILQFYLLPTKSKDTPLGSVDNVHTTQSVYLGSRPELVGEHTPNLTNLSIVQFGQ